MSKLLTVFGATGNQGGSVVKLALSHPSLSKTWRIRAITRDTTKDSAKALAAQGCEVVAADMDDPESLQKALQGSTAVFAVTNFWEHLDPKRETQQGKNVADAAKAVGVKHLVWSSIVNATKLSGGQIRNASHFDSKADVEAYIEAMKGDMIASYFLPAVFASNFKGMIHKGSDGNIAMANIFEPAKKVIPIIDIAADTGKYIFGLLEKGTEANGVSVQAVGEWVSPNEIVKTVEDEAGVPVAYMQIPPEVFSNFLPEAVRQELLDTSLLIRDFHYYGVGTAEQQAASDKYVLAGEKPTSWKEYVAKSGPWFE